MDIGSIFPSPRGDQTIVRIPEIGGAASSARALEAGAGRWRARTKTDTGRRDEYSQALERTLVKELGKLTP